MRVHIHIIRALTLAALALGGAWPALAAPLTCDVQTATECRITTLHDLGAGGSVQVDRALHIGAGGELRVAPGGALALDVAGNVVVDIGGKISGNAAATGPSSGASLAITATGSIVLDGNGTAGAVISADQPPASCGGGGGGTIAITSAWQSTSDSIVTRAGSRISANARCSGGAIAITASQGGIDIRGVVESVSTLSGIGGKQPPGGGPITISASCNLTINDTGRVSSRGNDPGADLVHLDAGGDVLVIGLVESTGAGHAIPNTPRNHCSGPDRADKPGNATACVEIWAGKTLVIDGSGTNHGEVNADTPRGGTVGLGWIDLFARRNIAINGTGGAPYPSDARPYAVHANQSVSNAVGGLITVKSTKGRVSASGQAIQAEALLTLGGAGGQVVIEAGGAAITGGDVDLGTASVRARGASSGGGPQAGGDIAIRSFSGHVLGVATGELNAGGGGGKPTPTPGTVVLAGCDATPPAVSYGGTAVPAPTMPAPQCGGKPALPVYAVFPASACDGPLPCQTPDCPPPCEGPDCPCVGPDCPCVGPNCPCVGPDCPCVGPDCPCVGPNCPCVGPDCPCVGPDCPCVGPDCPCVGPNCPCVGPDCPCVGPNCPCVGPDCQPYTYFCEKGSVKVVMDPVSGRFPGNAGPDVVVDVRTGSLQAAIDAASDVNNDGYIIIGVVGQDNGVPGGTGHEEIDISRAYGKPFAIVACGVSLTDPLPCDGQPVVRIRASATSPEHPVGSGTTLYVQDLTAVGSASAPGWLVKGDGRFLEGIGSQLHTQGGVKIVGNGNTMRNGFVSRNVGNGLTVQGQNNTVSGVTAMDNAAGDGISVSGSGNTVTRNAAGDEGQGNGGAGISVSGTANLVKANTAYANFTDGIDVAGGTAASPNIVKNNVAGGPQRGNTSRGIAVSGAGPGAAGAVDIAGNVTQANGLVGLSVADTGHRLKDNASGGSTGATNGACQFSVASGNKNATGNTRNGVPIAGADGTPFPNGCF